MLFLLLQLISKQQFPDDQPCTHTHTHTLHHPPILEGAPFAATGCNQAVNCREETGESSAKSHPAGAGSRSLQRKPESPEFSVLEFQETFIPAAAATHCRGLMHHCCKTPLRHRQAAQTWAVTGMNCGTALSREIFDNYWCGGGLHVHVQEQVM